MKKVQYLKVQTDPLGMTRDEECTSLIWLSVWPGGHWDGTFLWQGLLLPTPIGIVYHHTDTVHVVEIVLMLYVVVEI